MRLFTLIAILLLSLPMFGQFKVTSTKTTPLCGQPECEEEAKLQDSLNQISRIAQKSIDKDVKSDKPLRFNDYLDESDLIAYAPKKESKPAFQLVKSKAYFLESLNIVFFIPESYVSTIESITTPFARKTTPTNNGVGGTWIITEYQNSPSYFDNLTLPFRSNTTDLIHTPIQNDFFSLGH